MIAVEEKPELEIYPTLDSNLRIERTDISFQDLEAGRVRIRVQIHNDGASRSRPALLTLQSAPLGAFVPWHSLAVLSAPAIEPGESHELIVEVDRPQPTPLGSFDRVPPRKILSAVNSPDQPSPPQKGIKALLDMVRQRQTRRSATAGFAAVTGELAPDLWDLLGRGQPHWAGNLNVFVNQRSVEIHMAKALRVYAGRTNLAIFMVGGMGRPDAYSFEIVGSNPDWHAVLFDMTSSATLAVGPGESPIRGSEWVETTAGGMLVILATRPPDGCEEGNVEIQVRQRSSGATAIVEFSLDPSAQGTGCYAV
jgi:hypothetical protein